MSCIFLSKHPKSINFNTIPENFCPCIIPAGEKFLRKFGYVVLKDFDGKKFLVLKRITDLFEATRTNKEIFQRFISKVFEHGPPGPERCHNQPVVHVIFVNSKIESQEATTHTIHKVSKPKNSRSIPQFCCLQKRTISRGKTDLVDHYRCPY